MSKREAVIRMIVENLNEMLPDSPHTPIYEKQLRRLTDEQFAAWIDKLESGEETVGMVVPNGAEKRLSVERNLALAKKLDHEFFQHLILTDPQTGTVYRTPKKYLVVDLPLRRQIQLLTKKQSIPENNQHVDQLTDQPTGVSKGSKISFPELQILAAQQADASLRELTAYRGGDRRAYNYMTKLIIQEGSASHKTLAALHTRVKSTAVLSSFLKCMHLDNNL